MYSSVLFLFIHSQVPGSYVYGHYLQNPSTPTFKICYLFDSNSTIGGNSLYYVWTRWGRVGEPGQNALKGPFTLDLAKKEFSKKFADKTKNKWETRDKFTPVPGKYTLLEMDDDSGDEEVRAIN